MRFTKMHGAGNDYVFVDGFDAKRDWAHVAKQASDRHFGIGSDGLIVAVPSSVADVRMRMWNSDGSEAEMCGNGIRCFAKFVLESGLVAAGPAALRVETGAGVLTVAPTWEDGRITRALVNMGVPVLRAVDVPADALALGPSDYSRLDSDLTQALGLSPQDLVFGAQAALGPPSGGVSFVVTAVSTGNPHAVSFVDTPVADVPLERVGPMMEHHPAFPNRVNFHVVNVLGRDRLRSRTWERGAGETLACATGATGMVVAARLHGMVGDNVTVEVPGGELLISWPGHGSATMEGPVAEVFSGELPE
jgi:diaminopimelate epimerase